LNESRVAEYAEFLVTAGSFPVDSAAPHMRGIDLDEELNMVEPNCAGTIQLANQLVTAMKQRSEGKNPFHGFHRPRDECSPGRPSTQSPSPSYSFAHSVRYALRDNGITPRVPASITTLRVARSGPPILRAHIEVDGGLLRRNADIIAMVALDRAKMQTAHGENGGKLLTHVAVAYELVKVGKLEKRRLGGRTSRSNFR
jgi:hypothetical protein